MIEDTRSSRTINASRSIEQAAFDLPANDTNDTNDRELNVIEIVTGFTIHWRVFAIFAGKVD